MTLNFAFTRIDVHTRRVGGSFGIKVTRIIQGSVAAALVAKKLNRPCRFIQSLTTNMRAVGKRLPCFLQFEVRYYYFNKNKQYIKAAFLPEMSGRSEECLC